MNHDRAMSPTIEATGDPILRLLETMEILEAAKVAKQVRGLVSSGTVVTTECTVVAFLAIFQPKK